MLNLAHNERNFGIIFVVSELSKKISSSFFPALGVIIIEVDKSIMMHAEIYEAIFLCREIEIIPTLLT